MPIWVGWGQWEVLGVVELARWVIVSTPLNRGKVAT
jgi:hypothetical protein